MHVKSTPTDRVCEICGTGLSRGRRRFCSRFCYHARQRKSSSIVPHPTDPTAVLVCLSRGMTATIDAADADRVAVHSWHAVDRRTVNRERWYASAYIDGRTKVYLHQFIVDAPNGVEVDHRDGDGLNCRRSNIRIATRGQNARNMVRPVGASGYRGVTKPYGRKKWPAQIVMDGRALRIGYFPTAEEAAKAHDDAARKLHGAFAVLNFPRIGERGADGEVRK